MTYQEKRSIVSLVSTFLIFILYSMYVYKMYQEGSLNSTSDWGTVILYLIPLLIVFKIIIHIVFNIINKIATNEDAPSFSDELDKLIELKAMRNSHFVFFIGFFLSIGSLVIDSRPSIMFILLYFSLFSSFIMCDASQLYLYRKGV